MSETLIAPTSEEMCDRNSNSVYSLENANRQLLQNQSLLYDENHRLQQDLQKLKIELAKITSKSSVRTKEEIHELQSQKNQLIRINERLKRKLKNLKVLPVTLTNFETDADAAEKVNLSNAIDNLDGLIQSIKQQCNKVSLPPHHKIVSNTLRELTRKIEHEEKKYNQAEESLRKLRENDERYVLRDKISELKKLMSDIEAENTKLRFDANLLAGDKEHLKHEIDLVKQDLEEEYRKGALSSEEIDCLKDRLSQVENDNFKLKKEMIHELNEANRVKKASIDTEIALQRLSEAYESKRMELAEIKQQLDRTYDVISDLKSKNERLQGKIIEETSETAGGS